MMANKVELGVPARNPDVLTSIANLSNDEVFTPPEFANRMLDSLAEAWAASNGGANIWADPYVTFLDPFTKSGVFLREITKRLVAGLEAQIPDLQERVDHILGAQVYGIAITELTALLARRSVYCSKLANGEHSIATCFDNDQGNIWFERGEHSWAGKRCLFCGATRDQLDRGVVAETYAYPFIHADDPAALLAKHFGADVKFDVIIGNPPYQLDDGGHGASASPIYNEFVEQAFKFEPRFCVFVTPSRWFTGGKGLDSFRAKMLGGSHLSRLIDFPKLYEAFPGVKIRGGVSYFVWEADYNGPCVVQTIWDGEPTGPAVLRPLDQFDVLVRRNEAVSILEKVKLKNEPSLEQYVSSQKPFGLRTFFHGEGSAENLKEPVKFFGSQKVTWIERDAIKQNLDWVDKWKVLMTSVQGTSAAVETKFLSRPIIAGPGTACSETYIVAGVFDDRPQAEARASYLRTRFVRFLVSLRKSTQHAAKGVYKFVPAVPTDRDWTDNELYSRYGLNESEISFIESQVTLFDDEVENLG